MNERRDGALSPWVKAGWAAGDVGIACYVGGTMSYLLFFLTQAHGISPAWAGLALLVPRMIDVFADPLMGAISDRTNSRMGRRRPYLLYGSLAFAITFYMTFSIPEFADSRVTVGYVMLIYLLSSLAYTAYSIPHAAMAAEMASSYRERTSVVGYRMMGSRLGILTVALAGPYLFSSQATLKEGFAAFGMVFALVIGIGGLISFVATRNAPRIVHSVATFSIRAELAALAGNRPFRTLFLAFLLQNTAIGMTATTLVYFLTMVVGVQVQHVGWFASGAGLVAMLATPIWVRAGKVWGIGKRRIYVAAMVVEIVSYAAIFAIAGAGSLWLLVALYALLGTGDAACQLAPHSMVPDTVEADEVRTGVRRDGVIFGAMSGCLKLGMAIGAFLASALLGLAGFTPGEGGPAQSAEALMGLRIAYCLAPIALWGLALWALKHYDLDEASHDRLRMQLDAAAAERDGRHAAGQ